MADRSREILAWIGRQALQGAVPGDRESLVSLLKNAGFREQDILAALDGADETPLMKGGTSGPLRVAQLSDDATHFLNALRDLGYLDDLMEDEVLDQLMEEFTDAPRNIELDDLRRHVATVLFERQYELEPETIRFLEQEWRIAFH